MCCCHVSLVTFSLGQFRHLFGFSDCQTFEDIRCVVDTQFELVWSFLMIQLGYGFWDEDRGGDVSFPSHPMSVRDTNMT